MSTIFDVPGTNPPNPFVLDIHTFLASTSNDVANQAVSNLVCAITASADPSDGLWRLWDAFFISVATSPSLHSRHRALLEAIQAQPATTPTAVEAGLDDSRQQIRGTKEDGKLHWQELPNFNAQWRDVHDVLEAWRDWDGIRDSDKGEGGTLETSPSDCYVHFCLFSSALLEAGTISDATLFRWVFYACRNTLEHQGPRPSQQKHHRISSQQLWDLDIRITSIWVRDGATSLWEADDDVLRPEWADALDEPTALWPRTDGLVPERWRLWQDRLQTLSNDTDSLSGETRNIANDAFAVVTKLLEQNRQHRV
jgi:hypothetical protein